MYLENEAFAVQVYEGHWEEEGPGRRGAAKRPTWPPREQRHIYLHRGQIQAASGKNRR
jgi:hypothetical protein